MAEVEQRSVECTAVDEQEGDQEPPHPTVPVDEGVNGVELGVSKPDVDEDQ